MYKLYALVLIVNMMLIDLENRCAKYSAIFNLATL